MRYIPDAKYASIREDLIATAAIRVIEMDHIGKIDYFPKAEAAGMGSDTYIANFAAYLADRWDNGDTTADNYDEFLEEEIVAHFGAKEMAVPEPPAVIKLHLYRERRCENEIWDDDIFIAVPKNEFRPNLSAESALALLKERIRAYLKTRNGWLSNVHSCNDYNWGDFVMDLPLAKLGLFLDDDLLQGAEVVNCSCRVDQDERLAEGLEATGIGKVFNQNGDVLLCASATVSFEGGAVEWDLENFEELNSLAKRKDTHASVTLSDSGVEFELSKEDGFYSLSNEQKIDNEE